MDKHDMQQRSICTWKIYTFCIPDLLTFFVKSVEVELSSTRLSLQHVD